jgi:hypothetical protein
MQAGLSQVLAVHPWLCGGGRVPTSRWCATFARPVADDASG